MTLHAGLPRGHHLSVGFDGSPAPDGDFADTYNAQAGPVIHRQSREGINALFSGLEVHTSWRRRRCGVAT